MALVHLLRRTGSAVTIAALNGWASGATVTVFDRRSRRGGRELQDHSNTKWKIINQLWRAIRLRYQPFKTDHVTSIGERGCNTLSFVSVGLSEAAIGPVARP